MSGKPIAVTSGQQLLLPDATRKIRKERRITVAVNSRDRNLGANYLPNEFRWTFRRPLKDVTSVELVNAVVPADLYNVTADWGGFTFAELDAGGTTVGSWNVQLTPGQYTAAQLGAQLASQLNGLSGVGNTYTVAYSDITKRYTITASAGTLTFGFFFKSGRYSDTVDSHTGALYAVTCAARLLGFDGWVDYMSSAGTLTPPNRADPDFCLSRLYLHLNADNSMELNRVELGAGRKDCYHIFFLDQLRSGYYTFNKDTQSPIWVSSPAPLARMATLNVSIRDEFYRLVELSNHDMTLVFDITYLD